MILYCYISHNKAIKNDYIQVSDIMSQFKYEHYKIFYGGLNLQLDNTNIIHLDCDDSYEGLPNKIHNMCKYLAKDTLINKNYTHIAKVDSTTIIKSLLPYLNTFDYYGYVLPELEPPEYRRCYHFNKCSPNSFWNSTRYDGPFVPYCGGGVTYTLSMSAVSCVATKPNNPQEDIYEDLYVGKKLNECKIYPHHINMLEYMEKWN